MDNNSSQSQPVLASKSATPLAQPSVSIEYEVRNDRGTLLYTSSDLDLAKAWLRERAAEWPGGQVNEVSSWKTERRVYRPVAYLRRVA